MQLIKLRALCLATLLVSSFTSQVFAGAYSNIYAGAGLGYSKYSSIEEYFQGLKTEPDESYEVDENDVAIHLFAGWEFVPRYLAVEFSYVDFGDAEAEFTEPFSANSFETIDFQFRTSAIGVALKGMLPLGKSLSVFGKAGIAMWELDAKARGETYLNGNFGDSYTLVDRNIDGQDFFYSVGAEYHYSENLSIYGEYLMQEAEHDANGSTYNYFEAAILSAGITWRFDKPRRRSSSSSDKGNESESGASGNRNITACDEKYKDVVGIICDE